MTSKANTLGVPCYELLGGKVRDQMRAYWSHCVTWRATRIPHYQPEITTADGVRDLAREVRAKGFTALKTNKFRYEEGQIKGKGWSPDRRCALRPSAAPVALVFAAQLLLEKLAHRIARQAAGPDLGPLQHLVDSPLRQARATEAYARQVADHRRVVKARLREQLHVDRLYDEVKQRIHDMHAYLDADALRR